MRRCWAGWKKPLNKTPNEMVMKEYMTPFWEGIRFLGQVIMWIGGWRHSWRLIFSGLLVVIVGWANGLLR